MKRSKGKRKNEKKQDGRKERIGKCFSISLKASGQWAFPNLTNF
jgi:hypothetical protein